MLLRSSSAPILNSWLPNSKDSSSSSSPSSEPAESTLHLPRTKSVSLTCSFQYSSLDDPSTKRPPLSSASDHTHTPPKPKRQPNNNNKTRPHSQQRRDKPTIEFERLFSSSGLGEKSVASGASQTLVVGGGAGINGGDGGGRGLDGGDSGGSGFFEGNNRGSESTEAYYLKMIDANPGNSLMLGNYAKFLKEVKTFPTKPFSFLSLEF